MVQRPTPGSPLSISANALGDAYEAGESYQQRKRLGQGLPPQIGAVNPAVVRVRNDSGSDLAAGAVVEIGLSTLTALDRQNLWFSADVRSGDDPFCAVLLEPIPYGKYGNAQVAGVCIASVNVIDTDNTHARAVPGETTLKGDFGGWCRILYKPSGTGVLQCVVLICGTESVTRKIKTTSSIPAAGSGTANFYVAGSDRDELTIYHNWADDASIPDEAEIYARYLHDEDKWIAVPPAVAATGGIPWLGMELSSAYPTVSGSYITPSNERYCSVYSSWGDAAGVNVTINNSMTSYTSTCFTIDEAGWYMFVLYFKAELNGGQVTQSYVTRTTSGPSTGTSHTHTVDIEMPWFAAPWMLVERQRSAGGSWDNGIIAPLTAHYARTAQGPYIPYHNYGAGGTNGSAIASAVCLDHTVEAGDKFRVRLSALFDYLPSGFGNLRVAPSQAVLWIGRLGDAP